MRMTSVHSPHRLQWLPHLPTSLNKTKTDIHHWDIAAPYPAEAGRKGRTTGGGLLQDIIFSSTAPYLVYETWIVMKKKKEKARRLMLTFFPCPSQASQMCGTVPGAVALRHHLCLLPSEWSWNLCHGKIPRIGDDWRRLFWEGVQGSKKIQCSGGEQGGTSWVGFHTLNPSGVRDQSNDLCS